MQPQEYRHKMLSRMTGNASGTATDPLIRTSCYTMHRIAAVTSTGIVIWISRAYWLNDTLNDAEVLRVLLQEPANFRGGDGVG